MAQKTNPYGFRLGHLYLWRHVFFAQKRDYREKIGNVLGICKMVKKNLSKELFSDVSVNLNNNTKSTRRGRNRNMVVQIITGGTAVILTHRSSDVADKIEDLKDLLLVKHKIVLNLKIENIDRPEIDPVVLARKISAPIAIGRDGRLIRRMAEKECFPYAHGYIVISKGRLQGSEKSNTIKTVEGRVPLHTIDAYIVKHTEHVITKSGVCSVTVIINLKKKFSRKKISADSNNNTYKVSKETSEESLIKKQNTILNKGERNE